MKKAWIAGAALVPLLVGLTSVLKAQEGELTMPDFSGLERKATESVNVTLDGWLVHLAGSFIDEKNPDDAAAKKLLAGIKSVKVRSFQFASDDAYSRDDIEAVRRQLSGPGWTRLVQVRNKDSHEDVDVYLLVREEKTRALAVISAQPREFIIVNVTGSISLEDLPKLEKHLNIPNTGTSGEAPLAMSVPAQL
jgi:hypothetical protein